MRSLGRSSTGSQQASLSTVRWADHPDTEAGRAKARAKAEVLAEEAERAAKSKGVTDSGGRRRVKDAHDRLAEHEASRLGPDAQERDACLWRNHVEPRWGNMQLRHVRTHAVQEWVDGELVAKKGLAPDTVSKAVSVLRKTCSHAAFLDWIAANPVNGVRTPAQRAHNPKAWSEEATDALLDELDEHWFPLVAFMATTMVRPGEALGLQVRHLNPQQNTVRIEQQWTHLRGGELKKRTKTKESTRWTPVHPSVMEEMHRITAGLGPDEFVFVSGQGCPVNLQNFNRRVLQPAAIRAGLPKLTAYTLRHTAITRTVERLHLVKHRKELASWAGNSDRTMADVYTRAGVEFDGSELATLNDPVTKRRDKPANVVQIRKHG